MPEGQNGNSNGSSGKKLNPFNRGQVNHVNVEEGGVLRLEWRCYGGLGFRMAKRGRWEGVKHDLGTRCPKCRVCYKSTVGNMP